MSTLNIDLERGHVRKLESVKLRWTPFFAKQPVYPRGHVHIDGVLRRRMIDAISLNSFADSSPTIEEGLNAYIYNLMYQFEDTQRLFHKIIPASFKPRNYNRERDWFIQSLLVIWDAARLHGQLSLVSLTEALQSGDCLETYEKLQAQQMDKLLLRFVFFLLGCSTALYAFQSRPLSLDFFRICGYNAKTNYYHSSYLKTQVSEEGVQRPVRDFLQGFGRFPLRASKMPRDNIELHGRVAIDPIDFNAKVLKSTCGIDIVWTDILSAHLDYDERSKSLFLFKFPSFCLANIPRTGVNDHVNIVQRCWTEIPFPSTLASQEMANFMKEVLLTTHLIFSQFKKARGLFRPTDASTDPLLAILCGQEWPTTFQDWNHRPRRVYDLHDDFPIFKKRLGIINDQIALSRPKGLKELWKDDRDKLQWYTFWAVVIIGGSGVVLSICQTGLAAVQVWAIFQVNT